MPSEIGERSTLSHEIVNQYIIGCLHTAIKNRWECQSVIAVGFCMRHAVDLDDSAFKGQVKLLRKMPGENPRDCIHTRCFNRMNREEPRSSSAEERSESILLRIRQQI